MDKDFSMQHVMALKELLGAENEEEEERDAMFGNFNKGSVLNPGDIGAQGKKEGLAKPFSKIEVKPGTKPAAIGNGGDRGSVQQDQPQPEKKVTASKNDIWKAEEVSDLPLSKQDHRKRPEIDVLMKQRVGTEDVYLGMSGMDPSSTKCQEMLLKVYLPNTKFKEVSLDVTKTAMVVQSPQFYLHHQFAWPVRDKDGKAQWISDKEILQISLPIIREEFL